MRNHTLISPKIAPHILTLAIILAQPYFACKIMYTENPPHAFSLHEKNPSPEENREGVFSMFFVYSIY